MQARRRAERLEQRIGQPHPAGLGDDERAPQPGPAFLDHAPVADVDQAVGDRRRRLVVADDERRRPLLARELADQPVDDLRILGIELARRLVGQQQPRTVGEGRAQCDALLLAARERAGMGLEPVAEPDPLEQLGSRRSGRRRGVPSSSSPSPTVCTQVRSGESARA